MTDRWEGAYNDSWKGILTPESFQHPAKYARGLIERIVSHAFEQGWVKKNDIVVDPFGGVGCGGIVCAYRGLRWIGVELEPRFIELAKASFALHARHWTRLGLPHPVILQGDSRKLCELVKEAGCVVGSPPFSGQDSHQGGLPDSLLHFPDGRARSRSGVPTGEGYGTTPGQLGAMKAGSVQAVVGSPPFVETGVGGTKNVVNANTQCVSKNRPKDIGKGQESRRLSYAENTPGQLAALPPGSVASILSSPPYEGTPIQQTHMTSNQRGDPANPNYRPSWKKKLADGYDKTVRPYGETTGQLGSEVGDTFWSAARLIVEQCHQLLPPDGHTCWVVKDFVWNKQRVDFTGDWLRLCEAVGFRLACRHQAMLVKTWEEPTLFEGTVTKSRERKSFFRRLAEKKGSPRIDWETVLCLVRD